MNVCTGGIHQKAEYAIVPKRRILGAGNLRLIFFIG